MENKFRLFNRFTSLCSSLESFETMYLLVVELTLTSQELRGEFHKSSLQIGRSKTPWNHLKSTKKFKAEI
jgi:hypothetical protein